MVLGAPTLAEGSVDESGFAMKFLPYHRFEIESPLSRHAALEAIAAHAEPEKWFRWRWPSSGNDDRFEGEVRDDSFHLRRIIGYRNSFLPVIDGRVDTGVRGARITIAMRPFVIVFAFGGLWALGVLAFLISLPDFWWAALLMLGFLYLMVMGGFWFEAAKQERTLRRIFQAGD